MSAHLCKDVREANEWRGLEKRQPKSRHGSSASKRCSASSPQRVQCLRHQRAFNDNKPAQHVVLQGRTFLLKHKKVTQRGPWPGEQLSATATR
eukprot:810502-Pelagomonas_calceolata.AAC.1